MSTDSVSEGTLGLTEQTHHVDFILKYNNDGYPIVVGSMFGQPITKDEIEEVYSHPHLDMREGHQTYYGGKESLTFDMPPGGGADGQRIAMLSWGKRENSDNNPDLKTETYDGETLRVAGPLGQYCIDGNLVGGTVRNGLYRIPGQEDLFVKQTSDTGWEVRVVCDANRAKEIRDSFSSTSARSI